MGRGGGEVEDIIRCGGRLLIFDVPRRSSNNSRIFCIEKLEQRITCSEIVTQKEEEEEYTQKKLQ